uniref:Uncharacterized protein n=1 Tax=Chenopodium quinoa TaxID=63459 RepID=A0A803KM54_CHEQI
MSGDVENLTSSTVNKNADLNGSSVPEVQYFTSAAGVIVCGQLNWLEHDPLDLMTMWRFLQFQLQLSSISPFSVSSSSMPM